MDLNDVFETIRDNLAQVDSKVGSIAVYRKDNTVSGAIMLYGEYCHAEIDYMTRYLEKEAVYLDIGTNIGYHLRGIYLQAKCNCIGFEPHPKHFAVAAYNCQNMPIKIFNSAVGNKTGTIDFIDFDIDTDGNFGTTKQLDDEKDMESIEVGVLTIDGLKLSRVDVMKIDVEGHEVDVMKGARRAIKKFIPVIMFEANGDEYHAPKEYIEKLDMGYKFYWLTCRTFPVNGNFKNNMDNVYGRSGVSNILAVPPHRPQPEDLMPVVEGENYNDTVARISKYKVLF